ncbi:MAG: substrate-binding domain-containing protein [Planctomycetia bacterium]|nr:substrate-binding domain-containing protein [Planctomycetia bacterium]
MMAADYFISRGFQYFSFFSISNTPWARERCACFQQALHKKGIHGDRFKAFIYDEDNESKTKWGWWQGNEKSISEYLRSLPKPTAVLCDWDMSAFYLINICSANNIMVPEEAAILGYGNNADLCASSSPSLSSVVVNGREVGYQAALLLEKKMAGEQLPPLPVEVPATHIASRISTQSIGIENPVVVRAIGYIRENIAKRPNVSDVARNAGVSKTTLCRLFQTWKNCSPKEEILRCGIDWARELLIETDFSTAKIASFLQYSTSASFVRTFKRETGMTPMEFRIAAQGTPPQSN